MSDCAQFCSKVLNSVCNLFVPAIIVTLGSAGRRHIHIFFLQAMNEAVNGKALKNAMKNGKIEKSAGENFLEINYKSKLTLPIAYLVASLFLLSNMFNIIFDMYLHPRAFLTKGAGGATAHPLLLILSQNHLYLP